MHRFAGEFLTALRFLTILPLPWYRNQDSAHFSNSVKYFPLTGVLIGLGGNILATLLFFLPYPLLCGVILLYLSLISGFLHLDGFTDTADGLFSHRSREEMLAIMRDSRSGAMGVISLVFLLLIKFSALLSLPPENFNTAIIFLPLAGRAAIVFTMAYLPYARQEDGLGKLFYDNQRKRNCWMTVATLVIVGVLVDVVFSVLVFATMAVVALLFGVLCKRLIAGFTGDTLGGVCELTETAAAIILAVFLIQS